MLNTPTPPTHKTLLHSSVLACDAELTWYLLNRGANPFIRDDMGATPIDLARIIFTSKVTPSPAETLIYNILPKKSYPDLDITFSLDMKKMRTRSDLGLIKSPSRGSPPKTMGYPHSPPKLSVNMDMTNDAGHPLLSTSPASQGSYYPNMVPMSPSRQSPRGRQRSATMTEKLLLGQSLLPSVSEQAEFPPPLSPPTLTLPHTFISRAAAPPAPPPPSSPHYDRSSMQRAMTFHHHDHSHDQDETPFEFTFTHLRERAMSEAAITLKHHKAKQPLLRGFVSAGKRHAYANAPTLRKGMHMFTDITLLKLSSGNDCNVTDTLDLPLPQRNRSSSGGMGIIYEGSEENEEGVRWEISQLKDVLVEEVEVDNASVADNDSDSDSDSDFTDSSDEDDSNDSSEDENDEKGHSDSMKSAHSQSPANGEDDDQEGEERISPGEPPPKPPVQSPSAEDIRKFALAAADAFRSGAMGESSELDGRPRSLSKVDRDNNDVENDDNVACTACMDMLPVDQMPYQCCRSECSSFLCKDCMFRSTFVTITSALYAVPSMRCPGRCMARIPTRVWRGALKGVAVTDDDRKSMKLKDKVKKYPLLKRLDYLFESFEMFCEGYESSRADVNKRITHACNLLHRVELVAQYDDHTIQNVYNVAEEAGLVLPGIDVRVINNFEEFASIVLPEKVVRDDEISDSFLLMEDMLNDQDIESTSHKSRTTRLHRMCTFLAEIAVIVRTRLDMGQLQPISPEKAPTGDAEGLLMKAYCSNALALLTMRCGECEETISMFYCRENDLSLVTDRDMRRKVLSSLLDPLGNITALNLLRIWTNFDNGRAPVGSFVSLIFDAYLETIAASSDEDRYEQIAAVKKSAENGVLRKGALAFFHKLLSLILDMERRFAVQLEMLRKYPKIRTPCCSSKHCFLCKVEGHHVEETCAEVQQKLMGTECQYCPGCGVATLRSEGCNEIFCVCGTTWTWEGADENDEDDQSQDGVTVVRKSSVDEQQFSLDDMHM